ARAGWTGGAGARGPAGARRGPPATSALDAPGGGLGPRTASGVPLSPAMRPAPTTTIPAIAATATAPIAARASQRRADTPSNPPISTNSLATPRPGCQVDRAQSP